ncbi:YehS family protein [Vibrio porteresiae]|uniref:DUF1456 family protein n=1 Tax=Vibrio porteresiae DSM 19223 TaxID=1123496 RepID=A0ABZ0Q9B2_9VIBR|nr:DUF1456 family protein [Vibrio porteresiae]WPC72591.1 DUF1456 family protein [Vibrio porteresiae DSM 19223]
MTNNEVLRLVRSALVLKESHLVKIFALANSNVSANQIAQWLNKDNDSNAKMSDSKLASFLNGLIIHKRGPRDGEQPKPETHLNNNMIFQKLRIALNLKTEEMLNILETVGLEMNKYDLGSYFRKPDNKHYKQCDDETLREFLFGVKLQSNPDADLEE